MSIRALFSFALIFLVSESTGLSILVLEPVPSTSHHVCISTLVKVLLRRGHQVHFSSIKSLEIDNEVSRNYTFTDLKGVVEALKNDEQNSFMEWMKYSTVYTAFMMHHLSIVLGEQLVEMESAKTILELVKRKKFDVIVHDVTMIPNFYGIWDEAVGKPPVVGVIPFGNAPWLKDYVGGSAYPDVRPYTHSAMDLPLNLWQKTLNYVYYTLDNLLRKYCMMLPAQKATNKFIGKAVRPLEELEKSISILLINSHSSFEPGIPLPPNAIEIGGFHAQVVNPIKDQRLLGFLDEAKEGVLVVSLGTNVNWEFIEKEKLEAIITVFSTLKERVLWKLDIDLEIKLSKNVMTAKWLPQNDVLAHKNVKAIWTHAGLLSTHEAIWQGVPLIGTPFFVDQRSNIKLLTQKGVAVHLNYDTISVETVREAVTEILHNPKYTENMKRLSHAFRDRPVAPLDLAVWYVEHVARHPGRDFGYAGRFQNWIERNLLDVYAIIFGSLIILLYSLRLILKVLFRNSLTAGGRKIKRS